MTAKDDSVCVQIESAGAWVHVEQKDHGEKKTAKYLGLTVTGTLGVLVKAKRQGIIEEVRPLLSEMRQNGFYVSKTVESMVLEQAGE